MKFHFIFSVSIYLSKYIYFDPICGITFDISNNILDTFSDKTSIFTTLVTLKAQIKQLT